MSARLAQKLLLIGWDAADWIIIDRLFAQGKMPRLRKLVDGGVRAELATLEPKLSPLLWSSIATGKTADKHRILNFVEPNPSGDGLRVSASTSRRTKALWNMLTQSGLNINAISWYASHPAEPICGTCVTNLFQEGEPTLANAPWPMQDGTVHPAHAAGEFAPLRTAVADIKPSDLQAFITNLRDVKAKDDRPRTLAKQLARMSSVHRAALSAMQRGPWDCTMVFYETIDTTGHHFMQFLPPKMPHVSKEEIRLYGDVMLKVYEHHDRALGQLLDEAGPDTTVMLLSDHGFHSGDQRPVITKTNPDDRAAVEASWHRQYGVLVLYGPGIKPAQQSPSASLLDITPTALALLGLPVGQDMDGRVLGEALAQPSPSESSESIESWDTRAGDAGMHPDDLRNNPFESQDALNQLIDLGYMPALGDDIKARLDLVRRESDFNLAVVYMTTGRQRLAVPIFAELSAQKPDEMRFTTNLANCQFTTGEFASSAQTAREFLRRNPSSAEAELLLTASLIRMGEKQDAMAHLVKVERTLATKPQFAFALGNLRLMSGDWQDAARHFQRAKLHEPRNPQVLVAQASLALATAKWEDALERSLDALEMNQINPQAHDSLGIALAWLGDYPHAIQSFEYALKLQPGLIEAHRFMTVLAGLVSDASKATHHQECVARLAATQSADTPLPADSWGCQAWAKSLGAASAE